MLDAVRQRILNEDLPEGTKLPSHSELAAEYGIAPLTMRQVLARLEEEGLVQREQGRGTFVRRPELPGVMILESADGETSALSAFVESSPVRPILVESPDEALATLKTDRGIAAVVVDVNTPNAEAGLDFIRAVRRRWVETPLVAVTERADDLAPLHGTPEWPILVVSKPFVPHQMRQAIGMALAAAAAS
ncbi:MAG TPA: GntR family transcriptional regulator [Thermomicrobiales bacterium]|nr:GntR family transcriptional regulator [Thermomicrobiales bacterium]